MAIVFFIPMTFRLNEQGHPTDLFLTISVLQRKFCWLGTEVSAVLLGSKVLNLRSRIYRMYQKFLLEVFYPSNLLEIFFVRELCARSRALMIYLPLIKKSASGHRYRCTRFTQRVLGITRKNDTQITGYHPP